MQIATSISPIIPRHPLDHPSVTRIALGQLASDAVAALGDFALAVITQPDATTPQAAEGRRILIVAPCSKELLDLAFGVIRGSHKATRIKRPPTPSLPLTPHAIRNA